MKKLFQQRFENYGGVLLSDLLFARLTNFLIKLLICNLSTVMYRS